MPIAALLTCLLLGALSPAISGQSARERSLGLVTLDERETPLAEVVKRIGDQVEVDLLLDKSVDASRLVSVKARRRPLGRVLEAIGLGRLPEHELSFYYRKNTFNSFRLVPFAQIRQDWQFRSLLPGVEFLSRFRPRNGTDDAILETVTLIDHKGVLDWWIDLDGPKEERAKIKTCDVHSPRKFLVPIEMTSKPTLKVTGTMWICQERPIVFHRNALGTSAS